MHLDSLHRVPAHEGVRTHRHKLVHYPGDGERAEAWELFDLQTDPYELRSVYANPAYARVVADITAELGRLRRSLGDEPDANGQ
jgi:hypothetical protein